MPRSSVASSAPEPPLALVGPTATGKTAVGILLAEHLGAEIVGCDSRQIYRGLAVGSAQPTAAERARVPHHLVDAIDPRERYSAARYREAVRALLPGIAARGRVALFVGGTGLYLRAALAGLCAAPPAAPDLRRWLAALGESLPGGLHPLLANVDPAAADRVHPHDTYRQIRALEVFLLSGRPLSEHHGRGRDGRDPLPARVFAIDLDGAAIRARIARRLEAMLADGLLQEARGLFEAGLDPTLPALRAVGYPELFAHLRGETSLDEALERLRRSSWQYARRQLTWFRAVPGVTWIAAAGDAPAEQIAAAVIARLQGTGGGA